MKIIKIPKYIQYIDDDGYLKNEFVGYEEIEEYDINDIELDKNSQKLYKLFYEKYGRDFNPYEDNINSILSLKEYC